MTSPERYHVATPCPAAAAALPALGAWLHERPAEIEAVVFDVDGVLMKARQPLPGSRDLVAWLRTVGKPFLLLTNDGCHSPEEKIRFLHECGLEIDLAEIVSSSHGLTPYVQRHGWQGALVFVMGSLGDPCYAERAGLRVTRNRDDLPACAGVVVGEKDYDWQRTITAVFNFLRDHPDAPLIVPNPDEFYPGQNGWLHPASGAVGRFLQRLCQDAGRPLEPVFLGKPYAPIFEAGHAILEQRAGGPLRRDRTLMVGDFLASDIVGGLGFGYRTALVLTGITTPGFLARSTLRPELVFEHL